MKAQKYIIENTLGTRAVLTDAGASLMQLWVKGRNIVLGYDDPERYLQPGPPYGATVGRFANRIGDARFCLNGIEYALDKNDGGNCLHGGFDKWYNRVWQAEQSGSSVTFSLLSPDGDQGMPGEARVTVTYTLDEKNRLIISYTAVSDKDTYFNLTNHSYFNLGGSIAEHTLRMTCPSYAEIDSGLIPTGAFPVAEGHMGFAQEKALDKSYDHCYMLPANNGDKPFARLSCGDISIQVSTDLPAVQLYTGCEVDSVCLETQYVPDTPNHPEFPSCLFKAGQLCTTTTVYSIS